MKIYFLLATQPTNLGDLLINKMLIDELSLYGTVYVDGAGLPEDFRHYIFLNSKVKDFQVEYGGSLKRITALKVLPKVRNEFDFFFQSPGPYGGWGRTFIDIVRKIILSLEVIYIGCNKKMSVNLVGNDLNLYSKGDLFVEIFLNQFYAYQYVRSKYNLNQLEDKGFKNVGFIPDLAFLYTNKIQSGEKNDVFISFRNLSDEKYHQDVLSFLTINIPVFLSKGLNVKFFFQVKGDEEYNYSLYSLFKDSDNVSYCGLIWYDDIFQYNSGKFVVTNRLHVMLLGMIHGVVPFLLLNYDKKISKIKNIIYDMQLYSLIVTPETNIENLLSSYNVFFSKINEYCKSLNSLCSKIIRLVFTK